RKADSTPVFDPSANCASASERDSAIFLSDRRRLPCTTESSIILAMKIVQVMSEAKARPIITPLTMTSAERNIDQGDRSCGTATVDLSDLALSPPASVAGAAVAGADGAGCAACEEGADGADGCAGDCEPACAAGAAEVAGAAAGGAACAFRYGTGAG